MSPVQVGAQAAAPVTRPILSLHLGESVHLARVLTVAHGKHRRGQSTVLGQSLQTDIPIGPDPNLRDPQCNKGGVLTRGKGRGSTVLTYNTDNSMDCAGACKAIVTTAAMSPLP
ncbi:hypothetical protein JB92DRAFT_2838166 [Gautieria morchelliformis]|nr:hypothetical protein JB92DRAFT_2838166 [Gautieria morchelliformis]